MPLWGIKVMFKVVTFFLLAHVWPKWVIFNKCIKVNMRRLEIFVIVDDFGKHVLLINMTMKKMTVY